MDASTQDIVKQITELLATYGLDVVAAVIILIVGWMVAGWARRTTVKALSKSDKVDETLRGFFGSLVRYFVIIFTVLAVLAQFGIQTASLIAVFGAAGLAIGLALQGTLSNVAAGVMLLLFRPFKVGDFVEAAGISGTVKSIGLFVTELASGDNVQILAPNGQIWGAAVKNYSFHDTRRIDCVIGIGYEDDIDGAFASAKSVVDTDSRVLRDPEPMVVVSELADSSVNLTVRVWCNTGDYWPLRFALNKALKQRFDEDRITIPYPQRMLHLVSGRESLVGIAAAG